MSSIIMVQNIIRCTNLLTLLEAKDTEIQQQIITLMSRDSNPSDEITQMEGGAPGVFPAWTFRKWRGNPPLPDKR